MSSSSSSAASSAGWTAERVQVLTGLWRDGRSAAQIAKVLGGISRNAVIGKAHRLGLSARAAPSSPGPRASRAPAGARARPVRSPRSRQAVNARKPKDMAPTRLAPPIVDAAVLSARPCILDTVGLTARTCRWPIGEPGSAGFGYCGQPIRRAGPYCEGHRGLAYARPSRWQDEALRPPAD